MFRLDVLTAEQIEQILERAVELLERVGVAIEEKRALELFSGAGAQVVEKEGRKRVCFGGKLIERALKTAPPVVTMYNRNGDKWAELGDENVFFNPGSTALRVYDIEQIRLRDATTQDAIRFAQVTDALSHIKLQSTAVTPTDIPVKGADSFRLAVALLHSEKPIVTGTFGAEGFRPMRDMLVAVRGSEKELKEKPLAIFDCCPAAPLKWNDVWARDVIQCSKAGIPVELISMPQPGMSAPLSLYHSIVQHTAESLSGVVLSQLAAEGAPVIYGGSPTTVDMRSYVALLGAPETLLMAVYSQIGKKLGLPTHTYLGLSDAKMLNMRAGFEMGMGTLFAGLLRINNVSGAGMIDSESAQSLEGLVVGDEICGQTYRILEGVRDRWEEDTIGSIDKIVKDGMPDPAETLRLMGEEYYEPALFDRTSYELWLDRGGHSVLDKAKEKVKQLTTCAKGLEKAAPFRKEILQIVEKVLGEIPPINLH